MKFLWWAIAVAALGFVLWALSMFLGILPSNGTSSSSSNGNGWTSSEQGTPEDAGTGDGTWVGSVWDQGPGYVLDIWEYILEQSQ